jgi:hypothetical protein
MQCKDTLPVLFLYLRSANAFEPANAVLLSCAGGALSLKFTNLAVGTEKKGRNFLISEVRYAGNDSLYFLDQRRQTDSGAVEIISVYYLSIGWHNADCVPNQCSSKRE